MKKLKSTMAAGALALSLVACASAGEDKPSTGSTFAPDEGAGSEDTPDEAESTFENGVFETPEYTIKITSHKVIKPGAKGNEYGDKPVVAFWYETTNHTGADIDPSQFIIDFEAFQDNNPNAVNRLEVGSLPDDRFLDSQMETIKKGGTVENAIAYELDDLTTPVELVASDGFGDEVGRATYKLN